MAQSRPSWRQNRHPTATRCSLPVPPKCWGCRRCGKTRGEGFAIDASIIKADANRTRGVPGEDGVDWNDPKLATRAVHEYLQGLDETSQVGAIPKNISLTDPAARWTAAPGSPAFFAYSTNYLVDVN